MDSNESLVNYLCSQRLINQPAVRLAFFKVDRGQYAPKDAYDDKPQVLSHQSTISAPSMHAKAVELLLPYVLPNVSRQDIEGEGPVIGVHGRKRRILDIGSGSGFLVDIFSELAGETGVVVGLEHIEELRNLGEANMRKSERSAALLDSNRVCFRLGDGREGLSGSNRVDGSPPDNDDGWDAIHVGAAAIQLHDELVEQLRSPGRLFIPLTEEEGNWFSDQYIWTVDKDENGKITKTKRYPARYVSLMDARDVICV
ncbi:putative protein-L-isoaspartate O-methyltransferase [Rosellinia necatrix]|uniref:protein-L-isoaspartate(D-aspartate) O-methyltransferase n=1 Tax=Rosellinia necatrix TaxID=77044 RepID=A0A1W2TNR3_ROSNE|nr:putative protein-L-isoaspartate O-methyltransferase [Rosellinia necatrix]